jgi:hypothetical protein
MRARCADRGPSPAPIRDNVAESNRQSEREGLRSPPFNWTGLFARASPPLAARRPNLLAATL